ARLADAHRHGHRRQLGLRQRPRHRAGEEVRIYASGPAVATAATAGPLRRSGHRRPDGRVHGGGRRAYNPRAPSPGPGGEAVPSPRATWLAGSVALALCLAAAGKERVERFDGDPGWEG